VYFLGCESVLLLVISSQENTSPRPISMISHKAVPGRVCAEDWAGREETL